MVWINSEIRSLIIKWSSLFHWLLIFRWAHLHTLHHLLNLLYSNQWKTLMNLSLTYNSPIPPACTLPLIQMMYQGKLLCDYRKNSSFIESFGLPSMNYPLRNRIGSNLKRYSKSCTELPYLLYKRFHNDFMWSITSLFFLYSILLWDLGLPIIIYWDAFI